MSVARTRSDRSGGIIFRTPKVSSTIPTSPDLSGKVVRNFRLWQVVNWQSAWSETALKGAVLCHCGPEKSAPCGLWGVIGPWLDFFWCYIYWLLVCIVCFRTYPFSSLFPYSSLPLRIDPLHFQAGCGIRQQPGFSFLCLFVLYYMYYYWTHALVVLGLVFFSTRSQEIGLGKYLCNDLIVSSVT